MSPTQPAMTSSAPQMKVGPPRLLTLGAVLVISAYGLLLVIPVVMAMMVVSLVHLSALTFLIPLLAIAITTFFLPLGFGNPYVVRLVSSLQPELPNIPNGFIAQITLAPRLRTGLRALMEDADDVGWLSFTESELMFHGDSIRLSVPFARIGGLRTESIGWRGLFLYGPQTVVAVSGLPQATSFKVAERSSWLLPASRKKAKELQEKLSAKLQLSR